MSHNGPAGLSVKHSGKTIRLGRLLTCSGDGRGGLVTSILVVDDEPDARYLLRYEFERAGFDVREAANGAAALAAMAASAPDLVVTDVMMPVMNGVELIRCLRADPRTADIPILCVSGDYQHAIGADAALDKYGDLSGLMALVEDLLVKGRVTR